MTEEVQSSSPYASTNPTWSNDLVGTRATFDMDGYPTWEALLQVGSGPTRAVSLAGFRYSRLGGLHEADTAMQRNLITLLGAITLTSGHVELEMKRILISAEADPQGGFADFRSVGHLGIAAKEGRAQDLTARRPAPSGA